jgi:predicted acetyltransferase
MTVKIRPAEPEEMPEFARVVSSSLALPTAQFVALRPEWTLCAFEDGSLATAYAAWPFTMRMNGAAMPVAGVTTVSTHPIHRRRGNLRAIMEMDFHRRHEQAEPVAALYASLAAIYQRYGYGVVTSHHSYTVEPRYLQFTVPLTLPVCGRLRELTRADLGVLVDVYRRFRERRTGYLHRGGAMWEAGVLAPVSESDSLTILVYEEDGVPLGSLVYVTGPGGFTDLGPGQRLQIRDLSWLTPAAYRAFWEYLARYDLVREISWPVAPPDDPLPHLLLEPRMLNDRSRDGILARIIDVDRAFAARYYEQEGEIEFAVVDNLCPWNEGTWALETSGSETSVVRTTAAPLFTAPVSTLSMLLFGQLSASAAWAMGRLEASDPATLARCDALLRTAHRPFCPDHF